MKKIRKKIRLLVVLLLVLCFLFAGKYLDYSTQPVKSDVIIVLGGGNGERESEASHLYKEHYANYVMLTDGGQRSEAYTKKADKEINWLVNDGVPRTDIITELRSRSTYTNALYTKKLMEKYNFKSALVVSSSYHMRRAKYAFSNVYRSSGIKLTYQSAKVPHYMPALWWRNKIGWKYTSSEYVKLVGYWINYGIRHRLMDNS
jgi:uncharacterized SAM-binding protein YcdF (DUF218 family)